jgi:DNA mismatch repair protein MutH
MKYDENNLKSVVEYARRLEGNTLRDADIDYDVVSGGNKGQLGQIVEKYYFEKELNSRQEPDFVSIGLELKVCPIKKIRPVTRSAYLIKRMGLSAKERIVITKINYEIISKEEWDVAYVREKLNLLLMFYIHDHEKELDELPFFLVNDWYPNKKDLDIIRRDWHIIKNKITEGKAHEISEGDTMYLGACTKGASSKKGVKQPFNNIEAKERAFSLKRSYVDFIIEDLLKSRNNIEEKDVRDIDFSITLLLEIKNNIGKKLSNLVKKYKLERERLAKNYLNLITIDMLETIYGDKVSNIEEFNKAGIEIKCILISPNGVPKEHMSFEQIRYIDIIEEEWETSTIRDKLENKKQLWIVYKANKDYIRQSELELNDITLYTAFYWNMPIQDLDHDYYELWRDTVSKIKEGNYDGFMKSTENRVGHIRPKARDSKDLMETPQGTYEKKKSFWLNRSYIAEVIEKNRI